MKKIAGFIALRFFRFLAYFTAAIFSILDPDKVDRTVYLVLKDKFDELSLEATDVEDLTTGDIEKMGN